MSGQKNKIRLIGRREFVNVPSLGVTALEAKIDTGAYTSSIHCERIDLVQENDQPVLYFNLEENGTVYRFENFGQKKIKNSFGEMEERFVIRVVVHIGRKKILSTISLSNRDNMRYPILIGRRLLKAKFLIDVSKIHTGGLNLKRTINQLQKKL
jgi:hypothetical protein